MNEAVFVADLQAWHPPLVHVRMVATVVGDVNRAPAAQLALVLVIEVLQAVQGVQIPRNARVLAVDLKRVKRLVSARVTPALERGERAVAEPREGGARLAHA